MAHTFHLDPVALLEERDELRWAVRVAAHDLVVREQNEAVEKANQPRPGMAGHRRR